MSIHTMYAVTCLHFLRKLNLLLSHIHTHISAQPEQSSVQNRKATIEGRKRKQNFKNSPLWPSRFRIQVKNGILLGMNVLWRQQKCLERKAGGTGFANILLYKVVWEGKIEARLTNHTATEPQSQPTSNKQAVTSHNSRGVCQLER